MKIVKVSQFFDFKNMKWSELINGKEKGVLPSDDKTTFLWGETPATTEVTENEHPSCGDVWLKEGDHNTIEIYKYNYDTSD